MSYEAMFCSRLLVRDVVGGGLICAAGDVGAQCLNRSSAEGLDRRRLGAMASYGATAALPYHVWYRFLARRFPSAIWTKTALEVLIVVPLFEIPALVCWTGVLGRNQSIGEAVAQLRRDYLTACTYGLVIWGPASVLTFKHVPPRSQLLAFYAIGAVWDCGISAISFDEVVAGHAY